MQHSTITQIVTLVEDAETKLSSSDCFIKGQAALFARKLSCTQQPLEVLHQCLFLLTRRLFRQKNELLSQLTKYFTRNDLLFCMARLLSRSFNPHN
jgi:hypothetical protein